MRLLAVSQPVAARRFRGDSGIGCAFELPCMVRSTASAFALALRTIPRSRFVRAAGFPV